MEQLLEAYIPEKSYLNNVLNKLYTIFGSEEFQDYLEASELRPFEAVKKGFPNVNSQSVNKYEAYIYTSSKQNCLIWDTDDGVDVLAIVDVFLPDNALKYIWKYADCVLQWLWQFNLSSLTIVDMNTRIYSKASGNSANHFTLAIHTLADKFVDSDDTLPQKEGS